MPKPKRIPIKAAKEIGQKYNYDCVIIFTFNEHKPDPRMIEQQHIVTWGKNVKQCDHAAQAGDWLAKKTGWPEEIISEPNRVKKLKDKIAELEKQIVEMKKNKEIRK